MHPPVRTLPPGYVPAGSVSIHRLPDLLGMLAWSVVLTVASILLTAGVMWASSSFQSEEWGSAFTVNIPALLGGILLVTVVMLVLHEGLHGLVFWLTTRELPKFEFKGYYASASPGDWYLPRRAFLAATLLPLVAITVAGLALIPFFSLRGQFLLGFLVLLNASGAAGDLLVALRLARLPQATYCRDTGTEVTFFSPAG
ncbi:MAG TPA: DUF3267 domain-containing protein [Anaerolineaceae bacterium]|nr:DUF3267 domain-containing protein [Anaerolineaceae bacterium]